MSLDVAALRSHFPSLDGGIAHFDGPGGTQTPRQVGEAVARTLTGPLSNRGGGTRSEANAESAVAGFRAAGADLLGVAPECVVHGRSATQLTYDVSRAMAKDWGPGDEVVVSALDHDANVRPWVQAAAAAGAGVRWIELDPLTAELDPASVASAVTERTRLVAVTAGSNLLGTIPDLREISSVAHQAGARLYLDGVHYAAHHLVDLAGLGADYLVCSPYKLLGPHCGVLAAAGPALLEELHPDKLLPSTDAVPERFELGTLPYETLAGVSAAVDFLAGIAPGQATGRRARLRSSYDAIDAHETRLRDRVEAGLAELGGEVVVHSRAARRTPTLLLSLPGRRCWDAYLFLGARGVLAPAGSFYAYEPFRRLALPDEHGLRVGFAPYNDDRDVDRLLDGLTAFLHGTSGPKSRPGAARCD